MTLSYSYSHAATVVMNIFVIGSAKPGITNCFQIWYTLSEIFWNLDIWNQENGYWVVSQTRSYTAGRLSIRDDKRPPR